MKIKLAVAVLLLLVRGPNVPQLAAETDAEMSQHIVITIVYDDHPLDRRLQAGFGFACVIQGLPDTILFDTGGRGKLLLANMAALGIRPEQIGSIVLSHAHGDHTGGLHDFLQAHGQVKVFVPGAFPSGFKQDVRHSGAKVVETDGPCRVCEGAWTTGVLKRGIEEQGLYLKTSKGPVMITGCAHPGVVKMAEAARHHAGRPVFAVLGGFHMGGASVDEIHRVVRDLREMGVQQVAPCHCSGDKARRLMKEAFGEGYLVSGVGAQFAFAKLKPSENR
jgi:7,8-dihydropterin-6-yl-methyl-4-(beta-D-ribofuranosyl)aminobenzene 5'-phosphate synthase